MLTKHLFALIALAYGPILLFTPAPVGFRYCPWSWFNRTVVSSDGLILMTMLHFPKCRTVCSLYGLYPPHVTIHSISIKTNKNFKIHVLLNHMHDSLSWIVWSTEGHSWGLLQETLHLQQYLLWKANVHLSCVMKFKTWLCVLSFSF